MVSALKTSKGKRGKSLFERHTGHKPNTLASFIVKRYKELNDLDYDKSVDLDRLQDFPRDDDSIIFVRERQRKGKVTGLFKKRKGKVTTETGHTVKFFQKGEQKRLSKREIARVPKTGRKQRAPKRAKQYALEDIGRRKIEETTLVFADLEQELDANEKENEKDMPERMRRSRRGPDRCCLPVYICEVKKKKKVAQN